MGKIRVSQVAIAAVGSFLVAGLLLSIFLSPGPFYWVDSVNSYYALQQYRQSGTLLNYTMSSAVTGPFYPLFAMYGGSLFAVTALSARLVGSDWAVYGATFVLGVLCAFFGVGWLARLAGLSRLLSACVALVYVTSSYYLTNAYGRGAWAEFMSTSAFPLAFAGFVHVLTTPRPCRASMALLIAATALWSGSHLISAVYGSILVVLAVGVLVTAGVGAKSWIRPGRLLPALAGLAIGIGVNAWFLIPQTVYARQTLVSSNVATINDTALTRLRVLFAPVPTVSPISTTPHLYTTLPILPLVWSFAALCFFLGRHSYRRLAGVMTVPLVGYLLLLLWGKAWVVVPHSLYVIQSPYRLLTYTTLIICAFAIVAIKAIGQQRSAAGHRWLAVGAAVIVCQIGFATFQINQSRDSLGEMSADLALLRQNGQPPNYYGSSDYRFTPTEPVLDAEPTTYQTAIGPDGEVTLLTAPPPGSRVALDVPYSPFVSVAGGASKVGGTAEGLLVVDVDDVPSEIVLTSTVPTPARVGQIMTFVALALATMLIAMTPVVVREREPVAADELSDADTRV